MLDSILIPSKAPARSNSPSSQNHTRASAPEHGRSLFATVNAVGEPIRDSVRALIQGSRHAEVAVENILRPFLFHPEFGATREAANVRAAWALINILSLHAAANGLEKFGSAEVALEWFFGKRAKTASLLIGGFTQRSIKAAAQILSRVKIDEQFLDLIPYLTEPHEPSSRLTIIANPESAASRKAKKASGVFYTPSDVADYLTSSIASEASGSWLDPACGTGVFLCSALRQNKTPALTNVYGIDVSLLTVETCAFNILNQIARSGCLSSTPYQFWLLARLNLASGDALSVSGPTLDERIEKLARWKRKAIQTLLAGGIPQSHPYANSARRQLSLSELFPDGSNGFEHIVINPPYSKVTCSEDIQKSWKSFESLSPDSQAKAHLAFVEMMWRFGTNSASASAAAILPLSISYNQDRQNSACRNAIASSGGEWIFRHFDREPHSLFGEDVKTRNAILFRRNGTSATAVHTSRLAKWTSKNRAAIFESVPTASIQVSNLVGLVPKLGSDLEARTYQSLVRLRERPTAFANVVGTAALTDISRRKPSYSLYVATTAYNFINTFFDLPPQVSAKSKPFSQSPAIELRSSDEKKSLAAYAVIASRISLWLWHVEGDGFHVTKGFVEALPLLKLKFSAEDLNGLARLGERMWTDARETRVASVNGGRTTYSHAPINCEAETRAAESIILKTAGIDGAFSPILDGFIASTVGIDGSIRRLKPKPLEECSSAPGAS